MARSQKGHVEKIGKTLLGAAGNAYEPMLERHIGKPVVLELASPADPNTHTIELSGYLAEYSDKYLALFNVEQPIGRTFVLSATEPSETEGLRIEIDEHGFVLTNLDEVPLVVAGKWFHRLRRMFGPT